MLRELRTTYPAAWTDDRTVPNKYRVTFMPTTVFVSSDGTIFEKSEGAIDASFLARVSRETARRRINGAKSWRLKPTSSVPSIPGAGILHLPECERQRFQCRWESSGIRGRWAGSRFFQIRLPRIFYVCQGWGC